MKKYFCLFFITILIISTVTANAKIVKDTVFTTLVQEQFTDSASIKDQFDEICNSGSSSGGGGGGGGLSLNVHRLDGIDVLSQNGDVLNTLADNTNVMLKLRALSSTVYPEKTLIYMGIYDENNKLKKFKQFSEYTVDESGYTYITEFATVNTSDYVKAFIWEDSSLQPLADSCIKQILQYNILMPEIERITFRSNNIVSVENDIVTVMINNEPIALALYKNMIYYCDNSKVTASNKGFFNDYDAEYTLIKHSNENIYSVVMKYIYHNIYVGGIDNYNKNIYSIDNKCFRLSDKQIFKDGIVSSFSDIKVKDVVSIFKDKVHISTKKIKGTVSLINSGDNTINVNGTVYHSLYYSLEQDKQYEFSLNSNDEIVYAQEILDYYKGGLIEKYSINNNALDLVIVNEVGDKDIYTISENDIIKFYGIYTNLDEIYQYLILNTTPQVINFKLDNNKIVEIIPLISNELKNAKYSNVTNSFGSYLIDGNTVVYANDLIKNQFAVMNTGNLANNALYNIMAYGIDENMYAKYIYIDTCVIPNLRVTDKLMLVAGIKNNEITGIESGKEITISADSGILSTVNAGDVILYNTNGNAIYQLNKIANLSTEDIYTAQSSFIYGYAQNVINNIIQIRNQQTGECDNYLCNTNTKFALYNKNTNVVSMAMIDDIVFDKYNFGFGNMVLLRVGDAVVTDVFIVKK